MSIRYHRASFGAAVVVAFVCGLLFASGFDLTRFSWAQSRVTAGSTTTKPAPAEIASAAETETAFEAVADHARPAVVSIETKRFAKQTRPTQYRRRGQQQLPPGIEDFFRQFDQQPPSDQPEEASGSGFIVSSDGYILTNNHVVADADQVEVTLYDKRRFENAKVIGRDPTTDVAVIKIDGKDLPTLSLGDDAKTRVGQWVLAIGNPLQLDFTVTAGIISAKGRNKSAILNPDGRSNPYAITDYIQTDAAINPGNSGGPLLNIRGEVIGINSAIASGTGYYAGYGFAIPITLAHQVMDDLIKFGRIKRAVVGVQLNEVTATDARVAGLKQIGGAKVQSFSPENDSPAKRAGIEENDIIISAGGHPVDQVSTLQRIIRGYKPGDVVDLEVMRYGQKKTFKIKLGEAAEQPAVAADESDDRPDVVNNDAAARKYDKLGVTVAPLPPELIQRERIPSAYQKGLVITNVSARGPSWNNLITGEIIVAELHPAKRDIKTPEDLQASLSSLKEGDVISLKVYNVQNAGTRVVNVEVAKP